MTTAKSGGAGASNRAILWVGMIGALVFAGVVGFVALREDPAPSAPASDTATAQAPAATATADTATAQAPAATATATAETVAAQAPAATATASAETVAAQAPAAAETVAPEVPPAAAPVDDQAAEVASVAAETVAPQDAAAADPAAPAAPAPVPPAIDVVRVDAAGNAVIAGQAAPGAQVVLLLDGEAIDAVAADDAGNFVAMLSLAPSDLARVLSLEAVGADGVLTVGDDSVLIAPFAAAPVAQAAPATEAVAEADLPGEPMPNAPITAEPREMVAPMQDSVADAAEAPAADASATQPSPLQAADATPAPATGEAPQAPAVLIADGDGIRVAQGGAPQAAQAIQLDVITYDENGAVSLAGRGVPGAALQVTLDGRAVGATTADGDGQWSVTLTDVAAGTYMLRIAATDAAGAEIASLETPFLREDPARIRDNPMLAAPGSSVITVQRGFTLWGIAEANFGKGILYVQIFQENRDEIRDPDLIYPGQVFALPDLPRTGDAP